MPRCAHSDSLPSLPCLPLCPPESPSLSSIPQSHTACIRSDGIPATQQRLPISCYPKTNFWPTRSVPAVPRFPSSVSAPFQSTVSPLPMCSFTCPTCSPTAQPCTPHPAHAPLAPPQLVWLPTGPGKAHATPVVKLLKPLSAWQGSSRPSGVAQQNAPPAICARPFHPCCGTPRRLCILALPASPHSSQQRSLYQCAGRTTQPPFPTCPTHHPAIQLIFAPRS